MRNGSLRLLAVLALVSALFPAPVHAQFEVTEAVLEEAVKEVRPLVEKETGVTLGELVAFRLATREEIQVILEKELLPQLRVQTDDEFTLAIQVKTYARILSRALVAKFAFEEKAVLVCAGNLSKLSKLIDEPGLLTPEALRAILVHEFVHAADELKYRLFDTLKNLKDTESIQAFNAVIEGHAQFRAHRVCKVKGWEEGFETFTRSIGKVPGGDGEEEGLRFMMRIITQNFATAYYDGERFIQALFEKGGLEAVDRAFASPPTEIEVIFHPEWFLDPASRPKLKYDFESALGKLRERFDEEEWGSRFLTLTAPQLKLALSYLPDDTVDRIQKGIVANRVILLQPKANPQSKMVLAALYEYANAEEATHYVAAAERLLRIKDEKMKTGMIRVKEAKYETVEGNAWRGVFSAKVVLFAGQEIDACTLVASRGKLCVELTWSQEETTIEAMKAVATELLDAVRVRAGAEEEEDSEEE